MKKRVCTTALTAAIATVCALSCLFSACTPPENRVNVERTEWKMAAGTDCETSVYRFSSERKGGKLVIVGGTHGDEIAGWKTALTLVDELSEEEGISGEILLIPQVNILADQAGKRYPTSPVNGITYTDLNRAFPNGRADGASQATVALADEIVSTIVSFAGESDAVESYADLTVVDLHESQASAAQGRLGSTIISSNEPFFMEDLKLLYNAEYRLEGEDRFVNEPVVQNGSFSKYFTERYPNAAVFTVETDRGRVNGQDTVPLADRMRQQRNVLNAAFDLLWGRKSV